MNEAKDEDGGDVGEKEVAGKENQIEKYDVRIIAKQISEEESEIEVQEKRILWKKALYDNLLKTKVGSWKLEVFNLSDEERFEAFSMLNYNESEVHEKRISRIKEELDVMNFTLLASLKKKKNMEDFLRDILWTKIGELDEEMKEVVTLAVEENVELARANQKYKNILMNIIFSKEAWLQCPVCYQTAEPPIYRCPMDHLICSRCHPRMKGKCPTCRASFSSDGMIFRLAEESWRELQNLKELFKMGRR